ncbi:transposase-like protein [Paraburkholderia sp. GAS41]
MKLPPSVAGAAAAPAHTITNLNNIVEQDHRPIKRRTRPMMGFKDFRCARIILSGIETMHMIRKGQMKDSGVTRTAPDQFYSLVV